MKKVLQKVNKAKTAARTRATSKKAAAEKSAELNPNRFPKPCTKVVFDEAGGGDEGAAAARKFVKTLKAELHAPARLDKWLIEWGAVAAPEKAAKPAKAPAKKAAAPKAKKAADKPGAKDYVAPEGSNSPKTAKGKAVNAAVSKAVKSHKARDSKKFEGKKIRITYVGTSGLKVGAEGTIVEKTTQSAWPFKADFGDGQEHILDRDNFELIA